jgi:nitroreductase
LDLRETIRTTGAVREFHERSVPDNVVAEILDDARFAPSGGNRQPWRVAVVGDLAIRRQLADLMRPTWEEYVAATRDGQVPFNSIDYSAPTRIIFAPNPLLDRIDTIPVVLAVAADLRKIVATDRQLGRIAIVPGASIYPFCWSILLSARAHGLGGVISTFLSRAEDAAGNLLHLPEHHALAATIFLGYPIHQPTRLRRVEATAFTSIDTFDGDPFDRVGM